MFTRFSRYPNLNSVSEIETSSQKCAILTMRNEDVHMIDSIAMKNFPGEERVYFRQCRGSKQT
jgi:hypothetical protein